MRMDRGSEKRLLQQLEQNVRMLFYTSAFGVLFHIKKTNKKCLHNVYGADLDSFYSAICFRDLQLAIPFVHLTAHPISTQQITSLNCEP